MPQPVKCPHCGHGHPDAECVRTCALQRQGWRWRDEDGDLANGPFTKPGGGPPRGEVTLQPPVQGELWGDTPGP